MPFVTIPSGQCVSANSIDLKDILSGMDNNRRYCLTSRQMAEIMVDNRIKRMASLKKARIQAMCCLLANRVRTKIIQIHRYIIVVIRETNGSFSGIFLRRFVMISLAAKLVAGAVVAHVAPKMTRMGINQYRNNRIVAKIQNLAKEVKKPDVSDSEAIEYLAEVSILAKEFSNRSAAFRKDANRLMFWNPPFTQEEVYQQI